MNILSQISIKAEHGPYWLKIYETEAGVFLEDIFTDPEKNPAKYVGIWSDAILAATNALRQWDGKIEGFENYIDIADAGWTDIVIANHTLSELYPNEREHGLYGCSLDGRKR